MSEHWIDLLNEARTDVNQLIECLEYWLPDETLIPSDSDEQWHAARDTIRVAQEHQA